MSVRPARVDGRGTRMHPSHETAATIIAGETRLVASHIHAVVATGPARPAGALCGAAGGMRRVGLAVLVGNYLIAVRELGFLAPVPTEAVAYRARPSEPVPTPHRRERAGRHRVHDRQCPVRHPMARTRRSPAGRPPRRGGRPTAPARLRPAPTRHPALWPITILGALGLGSLARYRLGRTRPLRTGFGLTKRT